MTLRLLLIEDDRELRNTLREALQLEGYQVITAVTLAEAMTIYNQGLIETEIKHSSFDLVLLDLGLPDGDGSSFLDKIRRRYSTAVIVISARDADAHKIHLLDAGADDYLVKPFSVGEMLARIRVALRHRGNLSRPAITHYQKSGVVIDLVHHRVSRDDNLIHLTPTEFNLLARLVRSAGQVVTHRQLLIDVWGQEYVEHTHYLRLYMGQLRAKLEVNPAQPQLLLTEPGVGYRLLDDGNQ